MHSRIVLPILFLALLTTTLPCLAAQDVAHAVEGAVTKVDSAARTITVKTADGTEDVFKFTKKTTVHVAKGVGEDVKIGAVDSYLAGKEGTHVVVHYIDEGADKTAVAVKDFGKDTVKVAKGTVTRVDRDGHTVAVKTEDGAEDTYHVAKDASVDTEQGVVEGARYAAKEGDKVTVHYTDEAGEKVAHFIKAL